MELKETNHAYYCSENNFYVGNRNGENFGRCDYDSWEDFKAEWLGLGEDKLALDDDYNHVFRFDILEKRDRETDKPLGNFELWLFFILQRKGIYRPVWIKEIAENDMHEVTSFLEERWQYLKKQWNEVSK